MKDLNNPEGLDNLLVQQVADVIFNQKNKPRCGLFSTYNKEYEIANEFRKHNSDCDSFTNWVYLVTKLPLLPNKSVLAEMILQGVNAAFKLKIDFSLPNQRIFHLAMNAINKYYVLENFHKKALEQNPDFDKTHPASQTNMGVNELHKLAESGTSLDIDALNILREASTPDSFLTWLKFCDAYEKISSHHSRLAHKMQETFNEHFPKDQIELRNNSVIDVADQWRDAIYNWYAAEFRKDIRLQQGSVLTRSYP